MKTEMASVAVALSRGTPAHIRPAGRDRLRRLCAAALLALFFAAPAAAQEAADWDTDFEKSGGTASPDYAATMATLRRLEAASPWIRVTDFGTTPQGRALPAVIIAADGEFTPARARAAGKAVVLVMAGIHAGEIDGKDAMLLLLRDMAMKREHRELLDHAVLLFLPMFNADGHERRGRYNRINQDGPVETGWRTTAQNLNLNRDFLKADAPEMRAWLRLYNAWLPELLVDCHVTDGIDFQYNLTYSMEMFANAPAQVVVWQKDLERRLVAGMNAQGDPVCPYVFTREDNDLSSGLITYAAPPRFSTGYAAIRNRAALLVETHMLKPYRARVLSTRRLIIEALRAVNATHPRLREAVREADEETARPRGDRDTLRLPLLFQATDAHSTIEFLGWESRLDSSAITGARYRVWDHAKPVTVRVPYYDDVRPSVTVALPRRYLVPAEWIDVIARLQCHGIRLQRLTARARVPVETFVCSKPKWRDTPYEGRHPLQVRGEARRDTIDYPAGTVVVPMDQTAAKAAAHALEPAGMDSFLAWGFFDAIFEQKEYAEDYVMERVARELLAADTALAAGFTARLASDSAFAASPRARLNFFYERSPWRDAKQNVYPVGRCMSAVALPVEPLPEAEPDRRR
jgi:hypothetical protein